MRVALLACVLALAPGCNCRTDGQGAGPPVPASSDPQGNDLVPGAVVIAHEQTSGGVRIYKVKQVNWFPPPVGDEIVAIAFQETGNDFAHAADLWRSRKLTVAVENTRVQRHMFIRRDYRVIANEPVTDAERALKRGDPLP